MASSSTSQSISYCHGTQGYPSGFQSFPEEQHGNIRAGGLPGLTYRVSPRETASWKPSSLPSKKRRASIAMPETGFDTRCVEYDGSSNGLFDFSAGSSCMLLPRKRSVTWVDQQRKCNDAFSCMPVQAAIDSPLSTFNFQVHSDEPAQPELLGFPGLYDIESGDQGFPMPVNNPLLLNHAVTWPLPINSGDIHADHFYSLDRGILDMPRWVQEPPISFATSMKDQFLDTSPGQILPSYDLYSPFHFGEPWDLNLVEDMEDILLPSIKSNQPLDYTFHTPNSPLATRSDSVPTDSDGNTSSSVLEQTKALELPNILPRPPPLPFDAVSDINSNDIAPKRSAKRRCLTAEGKQSAARMRQVGSCMRCIARKIKCTEGDVCAPCQEIYSQYTLQQGPTCPRGRLGQYNDDFFPSLIFAHLEHANIRKLMSNIEFFDKETWVQLSLGPSYPSLPLAVCEFRTAEEKFSYLPDLTSESNDNMQAFAYVSTSQFGVRPSSIDQLTQTCIDYIEVINSQKKTRIGSSKITRKILDAARRFQASRFGNQDNLLKIAIKIAQIYLLMDRRFIFGRESDDVGSHVTLPSESSRVLSRQLRAALSLELKRLIPRTLLELDSRLRYPEKGSWAVSLLTHLLLCTCVEQIQVAIDAFIFSKIPSQGEDHIYTRQRGLDTSRSLEQQTLGHSWVLLDGILKGITKKENPFDVSAEINDESGLDEAEKNLMNDIRQIAVEQSNSPR